MKKSIKTITLFRFIQIFIITIVIISSIIAISYRSLFKHSIENEVLRISELVKAGLTSHMKAGIMDKKQYFLNEISTIKDIQSIEVIKVHDNNKILSSNINNAVTSKKASFYWNDLDSTIQAVVPYIANDTETLSCISCHDVNNGDVMGVVDITIDISTSQDIVIKYGYYLIALFIFFAILIVVNMFRLIDRYISKPLSTVIDEGEKAYFSHNKLDSNNYESDELDKVAKNINDFNNDIIIKEKEIYSKNIELNKLNEEIESTLRDTLMAMGEIEEIRSEETKNHTLRVTKLSAKIAREYGLSEEDIQLIELASPLHDIGKVGISDNILQKPGKLTESEFEIMKGHAELGYKVLKHSKRKVLIAASQIAYSHHEKWDGSGYPQGLSAENIPIFARIVAIVDVLDALLCRRVYKEAWPKEDVKALLIKEKNKHFEGKLVDIVLDKFDEYAELIKDLS